MAKWVCTVCGYVYEGEQKHRKSVRVCKAPSREIYQKQEGEDLTWAAEHVVGVAIRCSAKISKKT